MKILAMPCRAFLVRALFALPFFCPLPALSLDWQFDLGAGTNRVRRGVAYGDDPFVQARASAYAGNGWFFGVSGANVRTTHSGLEVIADAGYGWPLADGWEAQLAVSHYDYHGNARLRRFRYDDLTLTLDYRDVLFVSVTGSPNTAFLIGNGQIRTGKTVSWDLILRYPFLPGWSATAGIGYSRLEAFPEFGYLYGNAAVGWQIGQMQVNLSYIATDSTAKVRFGTAAENRWVASIWRHF